MKKNKFAIILIILILCLTIVGLCACDNSTKNDGSEIDSEIVVPDASTMFTDKDKDFDYSQDEITARITLSGEKITCDNSTVKVSDSAVTITQEGYYYVSGTGENVSIIVDIPNENQKAHIVLSDVKITNLSFAPIYIKNADKTFIHLEGSNELTVSGEFEQIDDNNVDGVIFAKDNVTVQGDGELVINSSKHGIVGKDDLKITGGTLTITASADGLQANDSVRIATATIKITSGKDGIHVENSTDSTKGYFYFESGSLDITAGYDGIDLSGTAQITGGTLTLSTGGGSQLSFNGLNSTKGIKSANDLLITGGTIVVDSLDDSIHSNDSIRIDGGSLDVTSGDDGIHADSYLGITGGKIVINDSYEGLEAQAIEITGGNISIRATDDGINAAGGDGSSINGRPGQNNFNANVNVKLTVSGGYIYVNAYGDGLDSNGNISISGGTIIVEGPVDNGNGALDYDGSAEITGGTVLAIGSSGMAMNFSTATQGSVLVNFDSQSAGQVITLTDSDGKELFSFTSSKRFSSVLVSTPDIKKGSVYTLNCGSYSVNVTMTDYIYGSSSFGGGGGFRPGGPGGKRP